MGSSICLPPLSDFANRVLIRIGKQARNSVETDKHPQQGQPTHEQIRFRKSKEMVVRNCFGNLLSSLIFFHGLGLPLDGDVGRFQ